MGVMKHPADFAIFACQDFLTSWHFTLKMDEGCFALLPRGNKLRQAVAHCEKGLA
jgi:hypothetical protein